MGKGRRTVLLMLLQQALALGLRRQPAQQALVLALALGRHCSCRPVARMECCAFLARGVHLCCGEGLLCPVRARDIARACSVHPRKARAPRAPHSRLWLLCCRPGGGQLTPPAARCAGTPAVQEGGAGAKVDVGVGRWATRPRRIAVRVAGGPWAASSRLERRSRLGARRAQRARAESGLWW